MTGSDLGCIFWHPSLIFEQCDFTANYDVLVVQFSMFYIYVVRGQEKVEFGHKDLYLSLFKNTSFVSQVYSFQMQQACMFYLNHLSTSSCYFTGKSF